jgi:hypothetical protein
MRKFGDGRWPTIQPIKITPALKKKIEDAVKVVKCKSCVRWAMTKRPCTLSSHGECDCPKCQGLCDCED